MTTGWHRESKRHSLAARGVETAHHSFASTSMHAEPKLANASTVRLQRLSELTEKFDMIADGDDVMTPAEAREFIKLKGGVPDLTDMSYEKQTAWLITELKSLSDQDEFFARRGDQFDNNKNILIWTSGETPWRDYEFLADYYSNPDGTKNKKFMSFLKRHNLMFEWQDAGTIHIFPEWGEKVK